MKKLNLICASIALLAAGAANAGTAVSTATKIAVENFGGSAASQDTLAVLGAPISYSMSTITAVNSGSTVYFTVRLTGGKFAAAPAATAFTFGGQACIAGAATATNPQCAVTLSTDKSTVKVAITTAASYTLGLGAFTWTPVAADINNVNSTLATVGGKVSASIGLVTLNPTAIEATDTQATIDAPLATGDLAVATKAITGTVSASGAVTYTGKIDLTASPAGSNYTITNVVNGNTNFTADTAMLGSYKFKNATAGSAKQLAGVNDYTITAGSGNATNTGVSVVVTPGSGQTFPVGSTLFLSSSNVCATALAGSTTGTLTTTNAATAKTLTTTVAVANDTDYFVCLTKPTGTGNTATPIQATITATVAAAATNDSIGAATGSGYNLQYNGSTVTVNTYWPAALAPYNFTGYLRVTNTGSVPAAVTATHLLPSTGAAGNSGVIIASLAAGQTMLLTSSAVEQVLGASPFGLNAARLRVTAPTDGLRVQSLLQFNSGNLVEFTNN
jgi:hypothetical protein